MVQTYPMNAPAIEGATIRALSSLTRRDADAVRATIRAAAMRHSVEEHDDYEGYLSLLITPASAADPSFLVAGTSGAVDLAELRGDEMTSIGTFPSIGAAMIVLRPALERTGRAATATTAVVSAYRTRHGDDASLQAAFDADAQPARWWPSIIRGLETGGEGL